MADYEVTMKRVFPASRPVVWALIADTNRWDRAAGLNPGDYEWRVVDGVRHRYARGTDMGFDIEWIEPPYRWIEGWYIAGERRFLSGPAGVGGFHARLKVTEEGTEVSATAYVGGDKFLLKLAAPILKARFKSALQKYFDAIEKMLDRREEGELGDEDEPAVTRARRVLLSSYDEVASGTRTECDRDALALRVKRLNREGVSPGFCERIEGLLRDRPDEELSQIRPFELARVWDMDRREVLRGFLLSTRAGLVDLRWQVNCPVCRVSANVVTSLEDVEGSVHCDACDIPYGIDFARHVEAVFSANPAVRAVYPAVYCASSPSFLPHVYAQLRLPPGESLEERGTLPVGEVHIRCLRREGMADVVVTDANQKLSVTVREDSLEAGLEAGGDDDLGVLRFDNESEEEITLLFERSGWSADAVLGSVVASFPEFMDLFATDAPAAGVELSVGTLALLFTDLTGSTALYEEVGDARAFAIVEKHFQLLDGVIRRHDGALIKTMGDAVMASFSDAAHAIRAAIEMAEENEDAHAGVELGLKIGVHAGPCLAVRANDRLDFFGTTVNVAARLQAKAGSGQLVVADELLEEPGVKDLLASFDSEPFEAELKGIQHAQSLIRYQLADERQSRVSALPGDEHKARKAG